jgi:hypothetical protein
MAMPAPLVPLPEPPVPIPSLSLIDRLIGYVDRPWKIFAVACLVLTGVAGMALWENRAGLAEAVLQSWVKPTLRADRFPKVSARLMNATGADIVLIADVAFRTNLITNIDGSLRDNPGWRPQLNPRPLFGAISDPVRYVSFIEGRAICHDVSAEGAEEERAEFTLGIRRRCYIAIPPVLDALVGIIGIGWKVPPSPEAEAGTKSLLWQAATELAVW